MHKVVNQYNALKLNEYQGTFEIVSGNDMEGKFWMDWAIASEYDSSVGHSVPAKKDDGSFRNIPIKVVLGDRAQAIENLKWLLGQMQGHGTPPADSPSNPPTVTQDDVPF